MQKRISQYYDLLSVKYDLATAGPLSWMAPADSSALVRFDILEGLDVLDLGAGTGQTVKEFVDAGCKVTAVDISPKMVERLLLRFPTVTCHVADLDNGLSFLNGKKFSAIRAIGVLEFVSDLAKLFSEVVPLLAANGEFTFSVEELIENHPLQKYRQSPCGITVVEDDVSNFPIFRYSSEDIHSICKLAGLNVTNENLGRAYFKTNEMHPIYYRYFSARAV